jgi:hypothetical protein
VAINTAILVTLLVNACFQQAFPGYQFKARLVVMLPDGAVLSQPDEGTPPYRLPRSPGSLTSCSPCISRPRAHAGDCRQPAGLAIADGRRAALLPFDGAAPAGRRPSRCASADSQRA